MTSTLVPGVLSGFVSDIATVSLFIPVVLRLAPTGIEITSLFICPADKNFHLVGWPLSAQRFETGDNVEQFLINATLPQTMKGSFEI